MAKNLRKITVNHCVYIWVVGSQNCDGDGSNRLTIWKDKKQIYTEIINGNFQITPLYVKEKIITIVCE